MLESIKTFIRDEQGLTTVEYTIAGAVVALGVVTAFASLSDGVAASIQRLATLVDNLA